MSLKILGLSVEMNEEAYIMGIDFGMGITSLLFLILKLTPLAIVVVYLYKITTNLNELVNTLNRIEKKLDEM